MYLSPTFDIVDTLYIRLNHGSKICVFPDPNAFYILRRQSMRLRLALETETENYLQVEGVRHVGPIRKFLWTPEQSMAILSPTHYLEYFPRTVFIMHEEKAYSVPIGTKANNSKHLLRLIGIEGRKLASFNNIGGNFIRQGYEFLYSTT